MNIATRQQSGSRRGSSIVEVSIAVVIASMTMVCISQLLAVTARQHRLLDRHSLAVIEAGNLMEDLISRPFEQIAGDPQPSVELSETCRQTLPDAKLHLKIARGGNSEDVRRITIRIDWQNLAKQRTKPVQLVAWKYRQKESQP